MQIGMDLGWEWHGARSMRHVDRRVKVGEVWVAGRKTKGRSRHDSKVTKQYESSQKLNNQEITQTSIP